ncbi:aminotransferase class I/II-fold pyridoxal phosphate-dependent enzyme [Microbacterium sp. NIBRBAC000506063]|uniref:aminotransferase class I/II-fold pyridoxal phosphate-dependent enzyme n=1 Tax=Microbacterium sp. NIBRBAC000506063 TaxID=2734618 RepID=UPI001BB769FC|nr:aminotransferase class I/II-fold pyridoxal phosphate-dependent enzyme [Microbacterium sp. NIBRBAC000506063]QTV79743.1 aminotransferase class I/II-fold pyridoxal phosphate-dependent enzyme [Microbacterium sp. NIBRBAC000506063]
MSTLITGTTAGEIADSVRSLRDRGLLSPGELLPSVRDLATLLGVNRNTAASAYQQLAAAGLVVSRGRAGTTLAAADRGPQEGYSPGTVLRDIGTGNPDPARIPDPARALTAAAGRPVLYGEPVIDQDLEAWALNWVEADLAPETVRITVTSGAVDAVERLLAQALMRDDAVALEDPCFLSSIHTVRLGGYRAIRVPVDDEGMTVDGLRKALDAGIRALICTPRAQNPTGANLSPRRAAELRALLADHPYVLIVEDDHFSLLAQHPYESLISADHERFALVRSVSKFLGPDMCLAVAATDPTTADRLAMRLSPGTTWVSHLLQRLTYAQLSDEAVRASIADAGRHYAARNAAFVARLSALGLTVTAGDGLNLWVGLPIPARTVVERLMRRGWLARTGDEFALDAEGPSHHLRLTVHDLSDADAALLATDLADAVS